MRSKPNSSCSSPSTPPSPLPVSTGPGNAPYPFSPSSSPSPPFTSPESSPLLRGRNTRDHNEHKPSSFSLDMDVDRDSWPLHGKWWFSLRVWFGWLALRCCCCCCPSLLAL